MRQSVGTVTLEANTQRVAELAARQAWMVSALLQPGAGLTVVCTLRPSA